MTYEQAEQLVKANLHRTGKYSELKTFPFYIQHLLIAPIDSNNQDRMNIFAECKEIRYDNKNALISINALNTDLDVFIIGNDGTFTTSTSLTDYLAAINKSAS